MKTNMLGKPLLPRGSTPDRNAVVEEMARLVKRCQFELGLTTRQRTLLCRWIRDAKDNYGGDCEWALCGCRTALHRDCIGLRHIPTKEV